MNKAITILVLISSLLVVSGCDNPVLFPETSKAITEKKQHTELQKQNELYERIAVALEKLATAK